MKTHTGWTYTTPEPGTYHWRSPHGLTYLRDHHGTLALTTTAHPCHGDPDPPNE